MIDWEAISKRHGFDDVRQMLVHHHKLIITYKTVRGLGVQEMAEMYGVCKETLKRKMIELEVERRPAGIARKMTDCKWIGEQLSLFKGN